jgi:hypothetical protein
LGLWVAAAVTPGCGRGQPANPVKLLPVTGKVMVDDRPLVVEGSVVFWPDPAKGNRGTEPATGGIVGEGKYVMYTGLQKGVPAGWYKVIVFPFILSNGEPVPKRAPSGGVPESPVDERYMDVETTPLTKEVVEAPVEGAYDLKLTR